jgi:hypothetical protein
MFIAEGLLDTTMKYLRPPFRASEFKLVPTVSETKFEEVDERSTRREVQHAIDDWLDVFFRDNPFD